jgi:hypothetical protein
MEEKLRKKSRRRRGHLFFGKPSPPRTSPRFVVPLRNLANNALFKVKAMQKPPVAARGQHKWGGAEGIDKKCGLVLES